MSGRRQGSFWTIFVVALLGLAGPAHAAFPGENGRIAFATDRDFPRESAQVESLAADDCTPAQRVVAYAVGEPCGRASARDVAARQTEPSACGQQNQPDDACGFEIYTMWPDGSDVRRLTNNSSKDDKPAWSPDGTKIAFESRRDCNPDNCQSDIYVMNADGSGVRRVVTDPAGGPPTSDTHPTWSPDGTKIAFESNRPVPLENASECESLAPEGFCRRVWVVPADATDANSSPQLSVVSPGPFDILPAWSPDGSRIAYTGFRILDIDIDSILFAGDIFTVPSDGSAASGAAEETAVTDTQPCEITSDPEDFLDCHINLNPTWSPDGAFIAFHRVSPYVAPDGASQCSFGFGFCAQNDVFKIRADGSDETQLTNDSPDCGSAAAGLCPSQEKPAWSPNGERIAFHADSDAPGGPCGGDPDCDFDVYTMNASDGSSVSRLTANGASADEFAIDRNPDWQRNNVPPTTAAATANCNNGGLPVTIADQPFGSGPRSVHFRIDGGAEQTLGGAGGSATIPLPVGRHNVEYWGEDNIGLQESPHHVAMVNVDVTAPRISIRSLQNRTRYERNQFASVRITATDDSGLASDPSRRSRRISTRRVGANTLRVTATDLCGNVARRSFRYRVAQISVAGVRPCVPSRFTARINAGTASVRRVEVFLDGRRIRTSRRSRLAVTINAGGLSRGRHRLRIAVTERSGLRRVRTVTFSRCVGPRFTG